MKFLPELLPHSFPVYSVAQFCTPIQTILEALKMLKPVLSLQTLSEAPPCFPWSSANFPYTKGGPSLSLQGYMHSLWHPHASSLSWTTH